MRLSALIAAFGLVALVGCDTTAPLVDCPGGPDCPNTVFDPDTIDFDAISAVDYAQYVQPLLAARNALSPEATTEPADLASVSYSTVLAAGPSSLIVPFDADASLLIRLAEEEIAPGSDDPYPNLSAMQDDEVRYLRRWIEAGAPNTGATAPAYADARALLYVCNQFAGRVSIVDVERQKVIRNVYFEDLGQPADAKPHHVVAEPDGSAWYVALIAGSEGGSVLKLSGDLTKDPASGDYLLASEMPPSGETTFQKPGMLALDPSEGRLFAGRSFSADPTSSGLGRFNLETLAFELVPTPDVHPHALGVSRDGAYAFTAALTAQNNRTAAYVLDAATGDLVDQEFVDGALAFVHYAVSPDGETVVLTSQLGAALYVFDFDTASGDLTLRGSVATGNQPWHPIFSPDGSEVFVPNRLSNSVSVVDPAALNVVRTFDAAALPFSQPHGSEISADGGTLFVSSRNFVMPMMGNMAAPTTGGMDHSGMDHGEMDHDGMDHSGMDHGEMDSMPAMTMPEIAWTPSIRFLMDDGTSEPEDLYGNVAFLDSATGEVLTVIQTGRWASGLALYDPR
ncbi:MAG: beta-propeller fold lactonase family protein [Bacteroidota bacterium]